MGKHEARITVRHFIGSMAIAIFVAFLVGVSIGYFVIGGNMAGLFQKAKTKEAAKEQPQTKVEEPVQEASIEVKKLTKDEQILAVKSVLKSYYDINKAVFTKLSSDSRKESQATGKTADQIFKDKLYNLYQGVTAKEFLTTMKDFIYKGTLSTNYYSDFFNSQEGSLVKSVEISDYKDNLIKAATTDLHTFTYASSGVYSIPNAKQFFEEFKGKGITQTQYAKLISLKPTNIKVLETHSGSLSIENINDKWLMTSYQEEFISTEITEVTYKGKTFAFSDFSKKYLGK